MNKNIMCVLCPNSCQLKIEYNEESRQVLSVSGNKCSRGVAFAEQEISDPLRTLTFSVLVEGGCLPLVSTRTKKPIKLSKLIETADNLKKVKLCAPVKAGDVVYKDDICKVIATKNIPKAK